MALIPTMGALHAGHLSLVAQAKEQADKVIATIFVNPTQFGPNEDYSRYPRTEKADIAALESVNVDAVYLPSAETMYPEGFSTGISVSGITSTLCGAARPGHFDGVAIVVCKLLLQALPDIAIFGEKDFQQLQVIRRMVTDLNLPVRIQGAPIIRESDGLAMSSRNRYLSEAERKIAPALHQTLLKTAHILKKNGRSSEILPKMIDEILATGFSSVDYLELRSVNNLTLLETLSEPARLLVAARLGTTRLIDNIAVE